VAFAPPHRSSKAHRRIGDFLKRARATKMRQQHDGELYRTVI
jgi:hypothetical protein